MGNITETKKIVGTAIFSALSFAVSFLEFSVFPQVGFLKLDFSNVFTLLGGFIYGPVSAVIISLVKELLCLTKSSSGGIGELANFVLTLSFVLIPTIIYRYKKGFKIVVITLIIGSLFQSSLGLIANRFVLLPFYLGNSAKDFFNSFWYLILLFNIIKTVAISLLTIVLYKRIKFIIQKI